MGYKTDKIIDLENKVIELKKQVKTLKKENKRMTGKYNGMVGQNKELEKLYNKKAYKKEKNDKMEEIKRAIKDEINETTKEQYSNENTKIFKDYGFEDYKHFTESFEFDGIESRIFDSGYIEGMKNAILIIENYKQEV